LHGGERRRGLEDVVEVMKQRKETDYKKRGHPLESKKGWVPAGR